MGSGSKYLQHGQETNDNHAHGEREREKEKGGHGHGADTPSPPALDTHNSRTHPNFVRSKGLTSADAEALLLQHGRNELEEKATPSWLIFLRQLYAPMPLLIWLAVTVELAIMNWPDAAILFAIQMANALIGWYETTKAGNAVAALKASLKPRATVKRDGKVIAIDAGLLVPGDLVILASGGAVPADCVVNEGTIDVDTSSLTGESMPVTLYEGQEAQWGSTCVQGEVEATVIGTGKNTFFGRTASLLGGANELGNIQKIILKITAVLVLQSSILCLAALIYLLVHRKQDFVESLRFVVVLMVASVPLAIEIVTTCTLAVGSRSLASMNAIVTRLVAIEEMAGMNVLCSDKTGTLTLNKMVIQEDTPIYSKGETRASVIQAAALAAKWMEPPKDALDTMVLGSVDLAHLDAYQQIDYMPFNPKVKRTEGTLKSPDGKIFKTTKGAPHIILDLCHNKNEIGPVVNEKVTQLGLRGIRCLAVAQSDEADKWRLLGILTFLDPPRPDTKETIERAQKYGVVVKMITGDQVVIALETSRQLGLGTSIRGVQGLPSLGADGKVPKDLGEKYGQMILSCDGFAQVFPEHKYLIVETLRQAGCSVGMTGDGVNDAPALKRADVGIAVQGATDAARAAADIVLTSPGLSVVVEAIIVARQIFQRVKSFINYRIAATLQLLCFFFIAVIAFDPHEDFEPPFCHVRFDPTEWRSCIDVPSHRQEHPDSVIDGWPSFFQLPVLMLMLITLLNDGTLITIGYDFVIPSQHPERWNLLVLALLSCILAFVACFSSLILLWAAMDSWRAKSLFAKVGLPHCEYGQVVTMIYLKVSISDFLTLFSSRTTLFFFQQKPGRLLFIGATFSLLISTITASFFPKMVFEKVHIEGLSAPSAHYRLWPFWVWLYCLFWWVVQDLLKVVAYLVVVKYNLFGANEGKKVYVKRDGHQLDPVEESPEEVVTLSYSRSNGQALATELQNEVRKGGLGQEIGAKYEKGRNGEEYLSVSYTRQSGKAIAAELRQELVRKSHASPSSPSSHHNHSSSNNHHSNLGQASKQGHGSKH
ncbi:P-type H[+]-ATPase [Chara braunii]|uniref:Plasma membrane ATPase n=1 Tax=Chara braunii TaxID=69332 RepID=A0A388LBS3_CHABU|nr:P-type H[+]-ATPase [Chara braunii]|eukprot:GBG79770.1 P-type H[+]-ATPase [Chara braunii]